MPDNKIAQYEGDSLRFLLLNYSRDRMKRDKSYRSEMQQILEERRQKRVPAKEEGKDVT